MSRRTGAIIPAYLPRWPEEEQLPRPYDSVLDPLHAKPGLPPTQCTFLSSSLTRDGARVWDRLKVSLYVVIITLMRHFDIGCQNPNDRTKGNFQKLLNQLYFEETDEIGDYVEATGDIDYDFEFNQETILRLCSLKHRYPIYNRLFDALRAMELSIPYWCILREVYIDVRLPPRPQFILPTANQYEQHASEYADMFYTAEELAYGKKDMLKKLANYAHWMMYNIGEIERPFREHNEQMLREQQRDTEIEKDGLPKLDVPSVDFSEFIQERYLIDQDQDDSSGMSKKKSSVPRLDVKVVQQTLTLNINPAASSSVQQSVNAAAEINTINTNTAGPSTADPSATPAQQDANSQCQQPDNTAYQPVNPPHEGDHNSLTGGESNSLATGTDNTVVGGNDNTLALGRPVNSLVQGTVTPSAGQSLNFVFHQTVNIPTGQQVDDPPSQENVDQPSQGPLDEHLRGLSDDTLRDVLAQASQNRADTDRV
ncbi:hypothetical protein TWF506_005040 [Arthrobotrys conoides]|uniref:Uncharacterized protein n=1 Tax=Arthrobotrys conoides TaxID=74498 RepID=A0AAN8P5N3_9PEZI